jgi:hypothetical protein
MPQIYLQRNQVLPAAGADATQVQARATRYGDLFAVGLGGPHAGLVAEGSYFRATTPTFGTGIAMGIQTAWSATANVLALIRNTAAASGPTIYMDYIKLICTAAGLTTTASDLGLIIDTANRYSAGGTLLTNVNANSGSVVASIADIRFGIVTALAAVAPRQLSRDRIKTQAAPCWVIGDEVVINFGANDTFGGLTSGAAGSIFPVGVGPVALGPGGNHSLLVHMWNPGNATTAPSWEVEMGWWER